MNPSLGDCCKSLAEGIFLPLPLLKGVDLSLEGIVTVTLTWVYCNPHLRGLSPSLEGIVTLTWGDFDCHPHLRWLSASFEVIFTLTWGDFTLAIGDCHPHLRGLSPSLRGDCHTHLRRLLKTLTWGDTPSLEEMGTGFHSREILNDFLPSYHLRGWHLLHARYKLSKSPLFAPVIPSFTW